MSQFLAFAPRLSFAGQCGQAASRQAPTLSSAAEQTLLTAATGVLFATATSVVLFALIQL